MQAFSEELKIRMGILSAAYEAFDMDTFQEEVKIIKENSFLAGEKELGAFCESFLVTMEKSGFEGIYKEIQSFIDIVTNTINKIDK